MIQTMIDVMIKHGDYPKDKLNKVLADHSGVMLEQEVSILFAEWTLNMKIPKQENEYYTQDDTGEWQDAHQSRI